MNLNLGLEHTVSFNLKDQHKFLNEFLKQVDTNSNKLDFSLSPWEIRKDYFGKINWGNFTIYQQKRIFLNRRIVLKIIGEITNSTLTSTIKYYNLSTFIFSTTILIFLSFVVMSEISIYPGLLLLIIVAIQTGYTVRQFENGKKKFIEFIEKINE